MNNSFALSRFFFTLITFILMLAHAKEQQLTLFGLDALSSSAIMTGLFCSFLFCCEYVFKKAHLKTLNLITLGLFSGYLLGSATLLIMNHVMQVTSLQMTGPEKNLIVACIFLLTTYLGVIIIQKSSQSLNLSIPFVELQSTKQKKKDIILDSSILTDARLIDLASSGLLDNRLILADFIAKDLTEESESNDENIKTKAKQGLEVIKKLELINDLEMGRVDIDFPELKENNSKVFKLAKKLDAHVLTADTSQIHVANAENVRMINIHSLSNALKPIMQAGEYIKIKIQRYGKEALQGIGYLEDGTMVVVNGGGEYIGKIVEARVLSVKHTSSGRMVFCNVCEDFARLLKKQGATTPYTCAETQETAAN